MWTRPSKADYRLANEKMDYLVSSLNAETYFPCPILSSALAT